MDFLEELAAIVFLTSIALSLVFGVRYFRAAQKRADIKLPFWGYPLVVGLLGVLYWTLLRPVIRGSVPIYYEDAPRTVLAALAHAAVPSLIFLLP